MTVCATCGHGEAAHKTGGPSCAFAGCGCREFVPVPGGGDFVVEGLSRTDTDGIVSALGRIAFELRGLANAVRGLKQ